MSAQDVLEATAERLWVGITNEPGFLLREWGGGWACDVAMLFLMDREQRVDRIIRRGDLPAVWLAPRPQRPSCRFDESIPYAGLETVTWKVRNVYAWANVAAEQLPGYPHDDRFLVRFAAGLYELADITQEPL